MECIRQNLEVNVCSVDASPESGRYLGHFLMAVEVHSSIILADGGKN
jgi:hypothetical protein